MPANIRERSGSEVDVYPVLAEPQLSSCAKILHKDGTKQTLYRIHELRLVETVIASYAKQG